MTVMASDVIRSFYDPDEGTLAGIGVTPDLTLEGMRVRLALTDRQVEAAASFSYEFMTFLTQGHPLTDDDIAVLERVRQCQQHHESTGEYHPALMISEGSCAHELFNFIVGGAS